MRAAAVAGLLGAEYIHWAVVDVHAREWAAAGAFFTAVALAEVALAVGIVFSRRRIWLTLAVTVNLLTLAVWGVARTMGLPFGPSAGVPESIGRADVIAAILELLTVGAASALLALGRHDAAEPEPRPATSRAPRTYYALVATVSAYAFALTAYAMEPAVSGSLEHEDVPGDVTITLVASELAFDQSRLTLPAGETVEVELRNEDVLPHNLAVYRRTEMEPIFRGEVAEARGTASYRLETPGPGRYEFRCDLHPAMAGVLQIGDRG